MNINHIICKEGQSILINKLITNNNDSIIIYGDSCYPIGTLEYSCDTVQFNSIMDLEAILYELDDVNNVFIQMPKSVVYDIIKDEINTTLDRFGYGWCIFYILWRQ